MMMSYVAGLAVCPAPMGATMAPSKSPVNAVLRKLSLPAERPVRCLSFSVFAIGILLVHMLMPRRFLGSHASSVLRLRFLGSRASSVLRLPGLSLVLRIAPHQYQDACENNPAHHNCDKKKDKNNEVVVGHKRSMLP